MAASEKIKNGMITACSQYSLATKGTTPKATISTRAMNQRSWMIGKTAWSPP